MKKLIIVPNILLSLVALRAWFSCVDLKYVYHFSSEDIQLQLTDLIHADSGPIIITRIFHNKILQSTLDFYKRYTNFFDPNLLLTLLSLTGLVGFIFGFWYFLSSKKNRYITSLFAFALIMPVIEVLLSLRFDFPIKLVLIGLPLLLISIYGHMQFIQRHKNSKFVYVFYIVIFILSIMILLSFPQAVYNYCAR